MVENGVVNGVENEKSKFHPDISSWRASTEDEKNFIGDSKVALFITMER
jgi:hypothetical protein